MPARREKKRDVAITSSALKLFTTQGYRVTSVRDICKKTQINTPSFYYYFPSKEVLYNKLMKEAADTLEERWQEGMAACKHKTMKGKLKHLYSVLMELYEEKPAQILLLLKDSYFPEGKKTEDSSCQMTSCLFPLEEEVISFLEDSSRSQAFQEPTDQVLCAFDRFITGLMLQKTRKNGNIDREKAWEMFEKGL